MLLLFLTTTTATNLRKLGIESEPGYLFGVINGHVNFISKFDLGHEFVYTRVTEEGHFSIEVKSMPNVFFSILKDDTLGYKFFGINRPERPDESSLFKLVKSKDLQNMFIMHEGLCLSYNKLRKKFEKRECDEMEVEQLFVAYCPRNGERIDDYLPPFVQDAGPKLLIE